jgi:hypothetical protein
VVEEKMKNMQEKNEVKNKEIMFTNPSFQEN